MQVFFESFLYQKSHGKFQISFRSFIPKTSSCVPGFEVTVVCWRDRRQ